MNTQTSNKIDKQFLFFLLQNICIGIFDKIDSSFGNHIDIDSICVLSSFTIITWTTYAAYNIGSYAFRITLKDIKLNLIIQTIAGILVGLLVYALHNQIPYIYSLTDHQNEMFRQCLVIHAISCPILAIKDYIGNYCEYTCKNKEAIRGNILLYTSMILSDGYVVIFGTRTLVELIKWTSICSVLYIIYMIFETGILKEKFKFNINDFKYSIKHGFNIVFDRLSGKVATIFFNSYASKLSTLSYSIHAVCYSAGIFNENFTNALYSYCVVSTAKDKSSDNNTKYKLCWKATSKYKLLIIIGSYTVNYIIILFLHGKAPLNQSLFWLALYSVQIFSLLIYEPMRAYLTSIKCSKYLKYGGVVGICIRIPVTYIGYKLNLGLLSFSLASSIDFLGRGVYFTLVSKKTLKQGDKTRT